MTPLVADRAAITGDAVRFVLHSLSAEDRKRFIVQFDRAAATGDGDAAKNLVESWYVTLVVRHSPDHDRQVKEFDNLARSGDLFEGTPFSGADPSGLVAL